MRRLEDDFCFSCDNYPPLVAPSIRIDHTDSMTQTPTVSTCAGILRAAMKRCGALIGVLVLAAAPSLASAGPAVDPALAQSIKELLVQMKYREQINARLQQTLTVLPQVLLKTQTDRINANTKLTEEQKRAELAIVSNDIPRVVQASQRLLADPKLVDDIIDSVVPIYAGQFTLDEVNTLVAFYKTPAAAKMQKLLPQITQEANNATAALVKERSMAVMEQAVGRK
jgi:hypothetical protein